MNAQPGVKGFVSVPAGQRFWSKVTKTDNCWLWNGATQSEGRYGVFWNDGKSYRAHRFAWESVNGPAPKELEVCHNCDVGLCVNPDHLFLGTHKENMDDAKVKGRLKHGTQPRLEVCRKGHAMVGDNVYVTKKYGRRCRVCMNEYSRVWHQKHPAPGTEVNP